MRVKNHPILKFITGKEITFTFEEKELLGYEGEPIVAALHANNVKVLKHEHRPRGLFCAIGNCSSCLMEVNGEPNVRVCIEPLREGMEIRLQNNKGIFKRGDEQ